MIQRPRVTNLSGAQDLNEGGYAYDQTAEPMLVDGKLFVPAHSFMQGMHTNKDTGGRFVTLMLSVGCGGISQTFSPEAARIVAQGMIEQADRIDAHVAQLACAAIEKARASGGAA